MNDMSTTTETGLTMRLAHTISEFAHSDVTEQSLREAERAFIDTIAVAIAAADDETVTTLVRALDTGAAAGPARSLVGTPSRQAAQAALVNGTACHALDFDDMTEQIQGHPSAVLVPAALAVGDEVDASGLQALEAYLVGYHVEHLLGSALDGPAHYALGWHATSTLGVMGAAAAAAYLYQLDPVRTANALAIAGTMSGGSRQNFGTMTKPLHAGLAASHGIEAAKLAREGFTASDVQLEAPYGFLDLFSADSDLSRADTVREPLHDLGEHRLSVKKYPACYSTHRTIDAVLAVGPVDVDAIESIVVTMQPAGLEPLIHHRPTTGLQGKFSIEYTVAASLLDGGLTLPSFEDDAVNRPQVQALLRKITPTESDVPPVGPAEWTTGYACVAILLRDGRTLTSRCDQPRGHATDPLSDDEVHEKFVDCVEFATGESSEALLAALDTLRKLDHVRDLPLPSARS